MGGDPLPEKQPRMSSRRFMINSRSISEDSAVLDGELFRHIVRVLRLAAGDSLVLVDEKGGEHAGEIEHVAKEQVTVAIRQSNHLTDQEGHRQRITVCQALPKGEKIDLILQKCTELGAHDFWLFGGQRSIARVRADQISNKLERWNRITAEAARQCRRRTVPAVRWFPTAAAAACAATQELRLILWEDESTNRLKEALSGITLPESVMVVIGPEGGFDPSETGFFAGNGFQSVSLGSRILRTETASIAIMAILQYTCDEI
ncbi:MAG: 16S rRNA (uracil(1498)-N(3))-methyltransferase [Desulfuromonadales bacterium]|nr:16S rRNA (uracil(1498)-N(3))-methyltransferase [Desulfuromonadales bacterium]